MEEEEACVVELYVGLKQPRYLMMERLLHYKLHAGTTVEQVKAMIRSDYGIGIERQELRLGKRKMDNQRSLKFYEIQAGVPAIAHLEFPPMIGSPITITVLVKAVCINIHDDSNIISSLITNITCTEMDWIGKLKKRIETIAAAAMGPSMYPRYKMDLYFRGTRLANEHIRLHCLLVTEGAVIVALYSPAMADDWPTCRL
ncbi:unnamed protein product [Linum trigynum]|uniref:Ubiquitin-like domain-containing protein n=1 Tax=Linum trigynum TaxID=586398 RepID=A0AAV2DFV4_9ROSI